MQRLGWDEVPDHVRDAIAALAGAEVVDVEPVTGGFSPCLAARLALTDGRRAFVKAVSADQNQDSPDFVRRELAAVDAFPRELPVPRLLGTFDDGHWVAGVFECVDGRLPHQPWAAAELASAFAALAELAPTPAPDGLPTAATRFAPLFDGWRSLAAAGAVPPMWADRVAELVALEEAAVAAIAGDRLVHGDIRADNMLVAADGSVVLVDWAHACRGVGWLDVVLWLPALELEGGGAPEAALAAFPFTEPPTPDELLAVVAATSGYFLHRGGLPAPPGLPTLRPFQLAQSVPALAWLDRLLPSSRH